jgi:uncharacterized protein (DUF302 family)
MRAAVVSVLAAVLLSSPALADPGLVSLRSPHPVPRTVERLEAELKARDLALVAKVDHAAAAAKVGAKLRPTVLLVFGNPRAGTPLLQCAQTAGIDLPQKALVWEDEKGQAWLSFNDPRYVASRHGMRGCDEAIRKMAAGLEALAAAAVAP